MDVYPDLSLVAVAPESAELDKIKNKVRNHASWILKQQSDFQNLLPILPAHKYKSGEAFRYLGRQHKLRIFKAKQESVRRIRGQLQVSLTDRTDNQRVKELLDDWFRNRANTVFEELWLSCVSVVERHGIEPTRYQLRKMKTRWGSCGKQGIILLNPELVSAQKQCIEYVIFHQFCHLKHFNHGAEFFELLQVFVPDWKIRREKLNRAVRQR
ncbi:MAG: M48 family metallopeptidase [Planctomycetaceae bacterium]|nr:M48 family metallopeptidase [Planctomycetaceae bacterium]